MSLVAALYACGHIVTGRCHGDAYSQLSEDEKHHEIESGFIDPQTLKFITDDCEYYLKKIMMMRHADSEGKTESSITEKGRCQVKMAAAFFTSIDLTGYECFCSPLRRCIDTASLLEDYCNIHFSVDKDFAKQADNEDAETFYRRVSYVLDKLPEKSLIISHCDFIKVMSQLAVAMDVSLPHAIPNCSITFIDNHKAVWIARECNNEDDAHQKGNELRKVL